MSLTVLSENCKVGLLNKRKPTQSKLTLYDQAVLFQLTRDETHIRCHKVQFALHVADQIVQGCSP